MLFSRIQIRLKFLSRVIYITIHLWCGSKYDIIIIFTIIYIKFNCLGNSCNHIIAFQRPNQHPPSHITI